MKQTRHRKRYDESFVLELCCFRMFSKQFHHLKLPPDSFRADKLFEWFQTSLQMDFNVYRVLELQAGLNGFKLLNQFSK